MSATITSAAAFAAAAHTGQFRKDLHQPYVNHPLRVGHMAAQLGMGPEFIAACYLHDVVEDTPVEIETIERMFPSHTARLVQLMTKWWGASGPDDAGNKALYYQRLMDYPGGALLKVLDRVDNLTDYALVAQMSAQGHTKAASYLHKTEAEFLPLLVVVEQTDPRAVGLFDNARQMLTSALIARDLTHGS